MLVTALACLLVAAGRTNAGMTVIVPVNVTGLHEEVIEGRVVVYFFDSASQTNTATTQGHPGALVGWASEPLGVVDRSFVGDWEVEVEEPTISAFLPTGLYVNPAVTDLSIFNATHYSISLRLLTAQDTGGGGYTSCEPNINFPGGQICNHSAYTMETYEMQEGPISDLIPQ